MRYIFFICTPLFSAFLMANFSMVSVDNMTCTESEIIKASLLRSDNQTCIDYKERQIAQTCSEGQNFYITQDGQCGCLGWDAITPPDICQRAFIRCEENQEFHSLFTYNKVNNYVEEIYVGCGCFSISPTP